MKQQNWVTSVALNVTASCKLQQCFKDCFCTEVTNTCDLRQNDEIISILVFQIIFPNTAARIIVFLNVSSKIHLEIGWHM